MKCRIVYRADGGISVIHPAPNSRRKDETKAEWLERVFAKAVVDQDDLYGQEYDDVEESEIPSDRKHRDAWTGSKGNGISIDAVKKAEIDAKALEPTDKEKIEALEARVKGLEKD